jgi:hypothetical protein
MDKKPLANTSRHLRNTAAYRKALLTNVSSSTAIETGDRVADILRNLAKDLADEKVFDLKPTSVTLPEAKLDKSSQITII